MAHEFSSPTTTPTTDDPSVDTVEMDTLETLATLDDIESLDDTDDPRVLYTTEATEDVQWVMSSELIEPLEEADVLELDYDEEMPTRVDGRRRQDTDNADFVSVESTDERPSLVLIEDERVDIGDVLRTVPAVPRVILPEVVPPPRRTIPPAAPRMSSIAPVAIPTDFEEEEPGDLHPPVARTPSRRGVYAATIGALAVAAATIAVWPSGGITTGMEPARITAAAQAPLVANTAANAPADIASEPVIHELDVVMILGGAEEATEPTAAEAAAPPADRAASPMRAAPAWKPPSEVVIDDSAQLTEGVVFPSEPMPEVGAQAAPPNTTLAPPAPPQGDPLPPFEASAASAAMGAAASAAQSCRVPGAGRFPARVSVTFAPSGRVTTATVDGPQLSGTAAGGCVATKFRSIRVNPFSGPAVTVHKTFEF
jgi:hypothetical protein